MKRITRTISLSLLAAACLAGLSLLPACSVSSGPSGGSGSVNLILTDAATDEWEEVTVVIKSASLRNYASRSWETVWEADPADPEASKVNLVGLSGVSEILTEATIPEGTYDRAKVVIDTDPATITLRDDAGTLIDPSNIVVVDRSGKGEIQVNLSSPITVAADATTNLQLDFDLAHPLSIFDLDGRVIINLKLRHKRIPRNIHRLQFARSIGIVKTVDTGTSAFTMETIRGSELTFTTNENTIFVDVDDELAEANLEGLADGLSEDPPTPKGVMVASNMLANGSLYARRVWYAANVDDLPRFSPEGLVRRVGENWLKIHGKRTETTIQTLSHHRHRCRWDGITVFVDENTVWTFQGTVEMGTGTDILRSIKRGFRVDVEFVDPEADQKVAASINVASAHDEGVITEATLENFTFGWWNFYTRMLPYGENFAWWFYGLPSSSSTVVQDFIDVMTETKAARLWAFARAYLVWEGEGAEGHWAVENLILAPEKLRDPTKISTAYDAVSSTMGVTTYNWCDPTLFQEMTVFLDTETSELQTVVASFTWNSTARIFTFEVPVDPSEWPELLTPDLRRVRVWVRPVKMEDTTFQWYAYTVMAYQHTE